MGILDFDFKSGDLGGNKKESSETNTGINNFTRPKTTIGFETFKDTSPSFERKILDPIDNSFTKSLMKNVSDFNKRDRRNLPVAQNETVEYAELFIYPPKKNYAFQVRPQVYNFQAMDVIMSVGENVVNNRPAVNRNMFETIPEMNGCIFPANEGHLVNLTALDDCWSFVLITDVKKQDGFNSYQTDSKIRTMSTGFIIGEPINPGTGSENPNAILKFCYHSRFRYNKERNGTYSSKAEMIGNIDVVPTEFKASLSGADKDGMMNLSPQFMKPTEGKVFAQKYLLDNDRREDYDDMVLNVLEGVPETAATKIHGSLKSTKEHLYTLFGTLDEAIHAEQDSEDIDYRNITGEVSNYVGNLSTMDLYFHKLSTKKPIIESGIAAKEIMSLKDLRWTYGNLVVTYNKIKTARNWEVYPSHLTNNINIYNSWVSNILSHICESTGIMEIAFSFDSWTGNAFQKEGRWRFEKLSTIHGADPEYEAYLVRSLQQEMENHVFSYLKHLNGDFILIVSYRTCSDTIIELNFHGDNEMKNAYYEHPTDKIGLVTPIIGDVDYWNNNSEQLTDFLTRVSI